MAGGQGSRPAELKINAVDMGCNAVVGLDMELQAVRDIPMIVATGTGVVLEDEGQMMMRGDNSEEP